MHKSFFWILLGGLSAGFLLTGCGTTSSGGSGGGQAEIAPPAVSRKLANQESVSVDGVTINDPRPFVRTMADGTIVGAIEGTAVRPALAPSQFEGITPDSTVLRIVVQLGPGYVDSMAGTGTVMWWRTDGKVLSMNWDWVSLEKKPRSLTWGDNNPF
ncbi:MAG: hypothetical protein SFY92_04320 [Verrucomicrobiae bacterium]|nr:hypothetical protein [Verrucomicrobiae bacterium]